MAFYRGIVIEISKGISVPRTSLAQCECGDIEGRCIGFDCIYALHYCTVLLISDQLLVCGIKQPFSCAVPNSKVAR
jgi:hypothetical protein